MIFRNTIANYIGQFYVIFIGIVVTPLFLDVLGPEQYGLIAFYTVLQAWMSFFDAAISPVIGREIAVIKERRSGYLEFSKLLASFEFIFFVLAVIFSAIFFLLSPYLASHWFNLVRLSPETVATSLQIIGVTVASRWFVSLYKSGLVGIQQQITVNVLNIMFQTLKFGGGLLIVIFLTKEVQVFFQFQLAVSFVEIAVISGVFYNHVGRLGIHFRMGSFVVSPYDKTLFIQVLQNEP